MGRQRGQGEPSTTATDLLNFHFSTPAPPLEQRPQGSSTNRRRNQTNHNNTNYRRNQPERRKRNPHLFNLHSSADHAFVITRHGYHDQQYSFAGSDEPVSWENVRIVKNLVPTEQEATRCPVCLDDFICGRITKCGHSFCLPCILRHVQVHAQTNPYTHVKCPCCAVPLHVPDLRPVLLATSLPPILHQRMKFVKLHRTKGCPSPYLPLPEAPKRSSSHAAPSMMDIDAPFCRFNYIDIMKYQEHLATNKVELETELNNVAKQRHPQRNQADVEAIFLHSSLDLVNKEIQKAAEEFNQEHELEDTFASAGSGVSQAQPPHLIASNYEFAAAAAVSAATTEQNQQQSCKIIDDQNTTEERQYPCRSDSIGSESEEQHQHHGDYSVGSSEMCGGSTLGRDRGDSIYSYTSVDSQGQIPETGPHSPSQKKRNKGNNQRRKQQKFPKASMYMDEESTHFYQCEDGQLCFLSRFNMSCLMSDFSSRVPDVGSVPPSESLKFWDRRKLLPLPDAVEGEIIEIESVNLTPELRKRWPFLAHLPLYTDIRFVEVDLNNILSMETKKKFKADFEKRRKKRQGRVKAEKREDRLARKQEEERIKELKARMQRIDPNDDFFQVAPPPEQVDLSGEAFGPTISGERNGSSTAPRSVLPVAANNPVFSFSNVTQSGGAFPALTSNAEANFPALGSSPPTRHRPQVIAPSWGSPSRPNPVVRTAQEFQVAASSPATTSKPAGEATELKRQPMPGPKKKGKGKKIVLFSTGGQRGTSY